MHFFMAVLKDLAPELIVAVAGWVLRKPRF